MARIYAALGLATILILSGGGLWLWGREGHQAAREAQANAELRATQLEAAQGALAAFKRNAENDREVLAELLRRQTQRLKESEKARRDLENALKDHRDWADQPIPSSVLDALSGSGVPAGKPQSSATPNAGLPNP